MRYSKAFVVLALCLYAAGARADGAAQAPPTQQAIYTMLGGVMPQGGVAATFRDSLTSMQSAMAASAAPIAASLDQMHTALSAQYQAMAGQLETVVAAAEAQYCTPASFVPSIKKPATFTGHSMSVTFSLGGCTFNETLWLEDGQKVLNCTQPSIVYAKNPANFTSKYHTAPAFTSKQCKVTKTFGEEVEKVLFVFDGSQAPDMNSLVAQITQEVSAVMGSMSNATLDVFNTAKSAVSSMMGLAS